MDRIERLTRRQIWLCIVNALGYATWLGAQLSFFGESVAATGVSLAGWAVWATSLVVLLWPLVHARLRRCTIHGDERIARNGNRSMIAAYWCLVVAAAVLLALARWLDIAASDVALIFCIVAVATPVFAFAVLEAMDGRG